MSGLSFFTRSSNFPFLSRGREGAPDAATRDSYRKIPMAEMAPDPDLKGASGPETAEHEIITQTQSNAHLTQVEPEATGVTYKKYKRRWFGLLQLALLNIVVSWDWLTYSPVVNTSADFFSTTPSIVNWLSTAFLLSFVAASPIALWALYHKGPKFSMVVASCLILVGNWVRYGGTRASTPSYGVVMLGQILCGFAQPFVLPAPTTYSELWFSPRGRITATAITSLANPLGGAVGELVNPSFVTDTSSIPNMTLYVAIISSVAAIPTFFIPAKPPTPVAMSSTVVHRRIREEVRALSNSRDFWIMFFLFAVYVGFFNSLSSLITQMMTPYGYSEDEASIAGALLILVGLGGAAVVSPLVDKFKQYLLTIRALVPILAACYLTFIWAPSAGTIAAPYVICAVLGAASFALVPVALEALAEVTYPVGPSFSSVVCWTAGQLLGAVFIIISDALEDDAGKYGPPGNLQRALIFQAVIAVVVAPFVIALGWRKGLEMRRLAADQPLIL